MGSFILQPDGKIFHPKTQLLLDWDDLPATMRFEQSIGNYPLIKLKSDFPTDNGTKFVLIDYCLDLTKSKSGKTTYAVFENFEYISSGTYKIRGEYVKFNFNFKKYTPYILFLEVNPDYYGNMRIIKHKEIIKNDTLEKNVE